MKNRIFDDFDFSSIIGKKQPLLVGVVVCIRYSCGFDGLLVVFMSFANRFKDLDILRIYILRYHKVNLRIEGLERVLEVTETALEEQEIRGRGKSSLRLGKSGSRGGGLSRQHLCQQ